MLSLKKYIPDLDEQNRSIIYAILIAVILLSGVIVTAVTITTMGQIQSQAYQYGEETTSYTNNIFVVDETEDTLTILIGNRADTIAYSDLYFSVAQANYEDPDNIKPISAETTLEKNTVSLDPRSSTAVIEYKHNVDVRDYFEFDDDTEEERKTIESISPPSMKEDYKLSSKDVVVFKLDKSTFSEGTFENPESNTIYGNFYDKSETVPNNSTANYDLTSVLRENRLYEGYPFAPHY